ncbi:MAG: DUF115 domain-containing protein, partial [Spirochaetales bacterium]|nr:DUF115 domain-containing protein [Spirochaetales bacterium]
MSLRARNLGALYRAHPELEARRLEEGAGPPEPQVLQILPSASGEPTACVAGISLHSRYDPVREASRAIGAGVAEGVTAAVFYGFGLGYQVEAFRRLRPGVPAVVIEPEIGAFLQALETRELASILGAPEVFWHVGDGPEAAVMTLDALPLGRMRVFRLPAAAPESAEYFRRVDAAVRSLLDRREVNLNTLNRFGRLWLRNLTANLREFVLCPGVEGLRGSFDGVPALVLAAGPSLDRLLPELPRLRERTLLVAVDTSFGLCVAAGVEPDLLVTVDPQYWNTRHLDRVVVEKAVTVSESSAHPRLFRRPGPEAPLYFVSSFFPLGRLLEEAVGARGRVGAGGSVATTAWDLARLLGCRPVYMGGLDLGYPGSRTHCRGAFFEERAHDRSFRLATAEGSSFQALREAGPFPVENNAGTTTLTDRRLIIYKWWFENQMAQAGASPSTPTFSLSSAGVRIEGMPYEAPEALGELEVRRPRIDAVLRAIRRRALEHRRRPGQRTLAAAVAVLETL